MFIKNKNISQKAILIGLSSVVLSAIFPEEAVGESIAMTCIQPSIIFGKIANCATGPGTVTVPPVGARTFTGCVALIGGAPVAQAATCTITQIFSFSNVRVSVIGTPLSMTQTTGAKMVVQALKDQGVDTIFGYPGGAALPIYDEIFQQNDIRHILVRHEQGATHAADAYARATGKPGVVLVTSGPGATNCVTGIATAYMDSIPLVVFTGQVPTHLIGNDAFQEVDAVGVTRPCVKHNFLVKNVEDLASTIKKAFYVATTGRPGPVLVDIPKDITADSCEYEYPKTVDMRSYKPVIKGHTGQMKRAVDLIATAKRPMIYSGGGVILSNANEELTSFTRRLGFPITNT